MREVGEVGRRAVGLCLARGGMGRTRGGRWELAERDGKGFSERGKAAELERSSRKGREKDS